MKKSHYIILGICICFGMLFSIDNVKAGSAECTYEIVGKYQVTFKVDDKDVVTASISPENSNVVLEYDQITGTGDMVSSTKISYFKDVLGSKFRDNKNGFKCPSIYRSNMGVVETGYEQASIYYRFTTDPNSTYIESNMKLIDSKIDNTGVDTSKDIKSCIYSPPTQKNYRPDTYVTINYNATAMVNISATNGYKISPENFSLPNYNMNLCPTIYIKCNQQMKKCELSFSRDDTLFQKAQQYKNEQTTTPGKDSDKDKCSIFGVETSNIIKKIITLIKFAVPILIVLLGILDFVSVLFASEEKTFRTAGTKFIKRLIAGMAIIFVPMLIEFLLNISGILEPLGITDIFCGL